MRVLLGALIAVLALGAIVLMGRDLPPPRTMVFAAGSEGGGYWRIAERYRFLLSRDGIDVTLLATGGSVDNVRLLAEGVADVGLVQGGVPTLEDPGAVPVEALAAVFLEPVFIYALDDAMPDANPARWQGLRVAAGGEGSGSRAAWRAFQRAAGLSYTDNETLPLGGADAAEALLAGEVDLVFYVAPLEAPYLRLLYDSGRARPVPLDHAAALSRRLEQSRLVTLPAGSVSLDPPIPAQDAPVLAMVARLASARDLHPALVDRLVMAAMQVHGVRSLISDEADFPTMTGAAMPVDPQARNLLDSGPSPFGRYLPWWIAAQISRVVLLLLPVVVLLIPLMRAAPAIYAWRMRKRVYSHYEDIRALDAEVRDAPDAEALRAIDARLAEVDEELALLRLPLPYRDYAYTARLHVDLVRRRVADRLAR